MEDLNKIEEKLKESAQSTEVMPFDEMLEKIRPQLKKRRRVRVLRIAAVAASFILLIGLNLTMFLLLRDKPRINEFTYGDDDLILIESTKEDVMNDYALQRIDLDLLINERYRVFKHKETNENVYYEINAYSSDAKFAREINLIIILQPKYEFVDADKYYGNNLVDAKGVTIMVTDMLQYESPFYEYNVNFEIDNVKFYMRYSTTNEGDIEAFMNEFLKD